MNDLIKIKTPFATQDQFYPKSHYLKVTNNMNKTNNNKQNMRPFFLMTLENEKNQQKVIKIFADSDPAKLAFNFCLENQMDYETMLYLKNNIQKIIQIFKKNEESREWNEIDELDEEYENSNINNKKDRLPCIKKIYDKNYKFDIFDYEINKFTNYSIEGEESSTERGVPVLQKSSSNHFNTNITNNEIYPSKTISISHNSNSSYNFNQSNKKDIRQTYLKTLSPKIKKKAVIKKNKISISGNNKNDNFKIFKNQNTPLKTNYIRYIPKHKNTIQHSEIMHRPKFSAAFSRKDSKQFNIKNNSTNFLKKNNKPEIDISNKNNQKWKTIHSCTNKFKNKLNKDYKEHIKNNNTQIWNTLLSRNDKKKPLSEKNYETCANTLNNSKKIQNNINKISPYLKNKITYKKIRSSYSLKNGNNNKNINNRNCNHTIQKCESKYKLLTTYPTFSNILIENSNKSNNKKKSLINSIPLDKKIKHRNMLSNDLLKKSKNYNLTEKKDKKFNNIIKYIKVSRNNKVANSTDFLYNNSSLQNNIINIFNKIFSLFDKDKNGILSFNGDLYKQFEIFPDKIKNIIINMFEKLINDKKYMIKINRVDFIEKMLLYFNGLSSEDRKILINSKNKINEMIKTDLFEYYKPKITYNKFKKNININ